MIARHAHNFGNNRQSAKVCANLVERQPELRPPRHSRRFHVADVPVDFRSGRQINPAARLERLERLHFEPFIFLRAFGAQSIFEPHEKLRPRNNGQCFNRQSVAFTVGLLALLVWRLCCRFSHRFLGLVLHSARGPHTKRHRQDRDA